MGKNTKSKKIKNKIDKVKSKPKKFKIKQNVPKIILRCCMLLIIIAIFIGATYLVYFSFTSSRFNISKIDVKGNSKYTSEEIIDSAKIEMGKNINRLSKIKISGNLKEMVYVDSVNIDRKYPNTIVLNIKERIAKYAAHNKDKNTYVKLTDDGIMLEEIKFENIAEKDTVLFGINFPDIIKVGEKIDKTEANKLLDLDKIIKEYEKSGINNKITSIKFENGLYLLTLDYKTDIMVDVKDNLEYKMSFLKEIIKETGILPGVIDMTKPNPYFSQRAG